MNPTAVGILSPGDMGSAIGRVLREHGVDVFTCLEGRSELTRRWAQEAGFKDVADYDQLVKQVQLLMSVLVPAEAISVAQQVAGSLKRTGAKLVYVDCNAVSPQTAIEIARIVTEAGATFIDAGIIGSPPRDGANTRFYCSGPDCSALEAFREFGLTIRVVGPEVGQASGLKMVYAASTKGTTALWTELLVAAKALGLDEALAAELPLGRSDISSRITGGIPSMPRRARRWVGEMEEIAATFDSLGLTPLMLQGAAEIYRFVGANTLADQTSQEPNLSLDLVIDSLARQLNK